MDNLKITIDQLKNYLGTGLKFNADDYYSDEYETVLEVIELIGLNSFGFIEGRLPDFETVTEDFELAKIKPHFYRLSDLDKFIPELGFVPLIELAKMDSTCKNVDFEINEFGICIGRLNAGVTVVFDIIDEIPFIKEIHNNIFDQVSGNDFDDMSLSSVLPSEIRDKLFQWNFWPFGNEYFDQGLVIDKLKQY